MDLFEDIIEKKKSPRAHSALKVTELKLPCKAALCTETGLLVLPSLFQQYLPEKCNVKQKQGNNASLCVVQHCMGMVGAVRFEACIG